MAQAACSGCESSVTGNFPGSPQTSVRCDTGMSDSALGKRHGLNDLSRSFQTHFSMMLRGRIPGLMDLWPDPH